MRVTITTVVISLVFLWSSYAATEEVAKGAVVNSAASSVAMNVDHQELLRRLATEVKPAAGSEVEITGPKKVPYWQQTVTRKRRRGVSE